MAINDPYDRSGQYSGGDTGPKVEGYGGLANDNPDRRDHAIGTMMGEGGRETYGYGGILDTIENRISSARSYGAKRGDSTLEGVVTAKREGRPPEYNAWSPQFDDAYGTLQRGLKGTPRAAEQGWYDQAMDVYDDFYDEQSPYRGMTNGATFYQTKDLQRTRAGAYQRGLQNKFGSTTIGSHIFTGPKHGVQTDGVIRGGQGVDILSPGLSPFRDSIVTGNKLSGYGEEIKGFEGFNSLKGGTFTDDSLPERAQASAVTPGYEAATGEFVVGKTNAAPVGGTGWYDVSVGPWYDKETGDLVDFDGQPIGGSNPTPRADGSVPFSNAGFEGAWGEFGGGGWGGNDGGTANSGMTEGGTSLGDGSYSDSAGYNDNSPQGML